MLTKAVIGNGNAARIHYQDMPEAMIVCVVDSDPKKAIEGVPYFSTVEEMIEKRIKPDYYDVCNPTSNHMDALSKILGSDGEANILVEKPVCSPSQLDYARRLAGKYNKAKIAVNENYVSSNVTQAVNDLMKKYGMKKPCIEIEFSKNRKPDMEKGRFLDHELLVAGYEMPHQMSVIYADPGKRMEELCLSFLTPMMLPNGDRKYGQGSMDFLYESRDGSFVNMFSSMTGDTKVVLPPIEGIPTFNLSDTSQRYRVFSAKDASGKSVIGLFEPVTGMPRNKGMALALDGDNVIENSTIEDNSMRNHQLRAAKFFEGTCSNPCDMLTSAQIVEDLSKAVFKARN